MKIGEWHTLLVGMPFCVIAAAQGHGVLRLRPISLRESGCAQDDKICWTSGQRNHIDFYQDIFWQARDFYRGAGWWS